MDNERQRQNATRNKPRLPIGRKPLEMDGKRVRNKASKIDIFQEIVEGARDAIIVVDNDGKVLYWNPACQRVFGYTGKEITGKTLELIIPERYRDEYRLTLKNFGEKQEHHSLGHVFESEAVKKDGTEFPVEVSISTIVLKNQWHVVCVARDISHWRNAQKQLGETLAKYKLVFNNQKDAIVLVDLETERFLEVNKAAIDMYGFSKEEFLEMRTRDIFLDEDSSLMVQPKPINAFRHKRKDGSLFSVEMTACVFMWKRREAFCAIVRDVSGCQLIKEKESD